MLSMYKTKTWRALELHRQGVPLGVIARELDTSTDSIRGLLWRYRDGSWPDGPAGRSLKDIGELTRPGRRRTILDIAGQYDEPLRAECKRRGVSVSGLCSELIEIIVRDNLFTAILDDDR